MSLPSTRIRLALTVYLLLMLIIPLQGVSAADETSSSWIYNPLGDLGNQGAPGTSPDQGLLGSYNTTLEILNYPSDAQMTLEYSSGHDFQQSHQISLHYQRKGGTEYGFFVLGMSSGNSGTSAARELINPGSPGQPLGYNIYNSSDRIIRSLGEAEYLQDMLYYIPQHNNEYNNFDTDVEFTLIIPADQGTSPGTYQDMVTLKLWASEDRVNWYLYDTVTIVITVNPSVAVDLAIVDSGGSFSAGGGYTMGFDPLVPGAMKHADVIVRATTSYSVYALSENGGEMVHEQFTDEGIGYTFTFGGTQFSLASETPVPLFEHVEPNNLEGDRYPVTITIGDFGWKPAGKYSDNITFEVTAN